MSNINFKGGPIDYAGIRKVIDSMPRSCRECDWVEMKKQGNLCPNCCMKSNTTYITKTSKRPRVYPSQKVFAKFGLINLPAMGKHMFFHFLDNEEMDFIYPPIPDEDLFGNISERLALQVGFDITDKKVRKKENIRFFLWHIHHENEKYWDDSKNNRLLCLNTEHPRFAARSKH